MKGPHLRKYNGQPPGSPKQLRDTLVECIEPVARGTAGAVPARPHVSRRFIVFSQGAEKPRGANSVEAEQSKQQPEDQVNGYVGARVDGPGPFEGDWDDYERVQY